MHGVAFFTGFIALLAAAAVAFSVHQAKPYVTYRVGCDVAAVTGLSLWVDVSQLPAAVAIDSISVAGITIAQPGTLPGPAHTDTASSYMAAFGVLVVLYGTSALTALVSLAQCCVACCGGRRGLIATVVLQSVFVIAAAAYVAYRIVDHRNQLDDLTMKLPELEQQGVAAVCGSLVKTVTLDVTTYAVIAAVVAALFNVTLAVFVGRRSEQPPQLVAVVGTDLTADHGPYHPQAEYTKIQIN